MSQRSETRQSNPAIRLAVVMGCAMLLVGCGSRNTQTGLIGEETLTALGQQWPNEVEASGPSITSLDRTHWEPIVVTVPLRQVEHWPTYVTTVSAGHGLRAEGEYPQGASVADEQATAALEDVGIEAKAIVLAAMDLVISPVRAVLAPPWSVARSSSQWFAMLPDRGDYDIGAWTGVATEETAPPAGP